MAPSIHVMHRVVHSKISTDGQYLYTGQKITNWGQHSNLCNLIRHLHQEFELEAPVPENLVNRHPGGSLASDAPNIGEEKEEQPQPEDIVVEDGNKGQDVEPVP